MKEFLRDYELAKEGEIPITLSEDIAIEREDEGTIYLNLSLQAMGPKGLIKQVETPSDINYLVIVARNITQSVLSKRLLKEEREKSDQLLRHILPPIIVEGLQRGETEISFAVPSASILFLDIVEFTPWCASLQAAQVMSTLNLLFIEFDSLLAQYETLTKIKCIGDCYMAAGGIFEGPNGFCSPVQHASEMIKFGIGAIHAIEKVNGEINQHLRIRVGINTGGPIVAGVLGVDRPTFEIFGPAINMAQQMEHHGVPMHVHISKNVFDLVFAENFKIKPRGEIEVKQGIVTTYVVAP
jgi:class 3 adenylate cyclase